MSYTRFEIGRKRGAKVTFADEHDDCTCTDKVKLTEKLFVATRDEACPVHQDAPGD